MGYQTLPIGYFSELQIGATCHRVIHFQYKLFQLKTMATPYQMERIE
jgi:hypothetical protein